MQERVEKEIEEVVRKKTRTDIVVPLKVSMLIKLSAFIFTF